MTYLQPISLACALGVLLATAPCVAQGWGTTFEPAAVNSYVAEAGHKFVVVAAGSGADAAAASLEEALRGGSAALVMNDDALGDVSGLDDDAIIGKAKRLPVDRIAIVRVFEGSGGQASTAVITVVDKEGEVDWALTAPEGAAVEAQGGPVSASGGLGVSSEAAESVSEVTHEDSTSKEEAIEIYEKSFVWFLDSYGVDGGGRIQSSWSNVYMGKYKKPLEPAAFYREVGRSDLAKAYESNESRADVASTLGGVGLLGTLGFGTWAIVSYATGEGDSSIPIVLTGVSAVVWITGIALVPSELHPVSDSEARELADKHNKKLRATLGLDDEAGTVIPQLQPQRRDFGINLGFTEGGVGGTLQLRW